MKDNYSLGIFGVEGRISDFKWYYGVATISRLLKIIGLFCKRDINKRLYSTKETYNFKEPTNRSHPIPWNLTLHLQRQQPHKTQALATKVAKLWEQARTCRTFPPRSQTCCWKHRHTDTNVFFKKTHRHTPTDTHTHTHTHKPDPSGSTRTAYFSTSLSNVLFKFSCTQSNTTQTNRPTKSHASCFLHMLQ